MQSSHTPIDAANLAQYQRAAAFAIYHNALTSQAPIDDSLSLLRDGLHLLMQIPGNNRLISDYGHCLIIQSTIVLTHLNKVLHAFYSNQDMLTIEAGLTYFEMASNENTAYSRLLQTLKKICPAEIKNTLESYNTEHTHAFYNIARQCVLVLQKQVLLKLELAKLSPEPYADEQLKLVEEAITIAMHPELIAYSINNERTAAEKYVFCEFLRQSSKLLSEYGNQDFYTYTDDHDTAIYFHQTIAALLNIIPQSLLTETDLAKIAFHTGMALELIEPEVPAGADTIIFTDNSSGVRINGIFATTYTNQKTPEVDTANQDGLTQNRNGK